jgi:hypothetical protein
LRDVGLSRAARLYVASRPSRLVANHGHGERSFPGENVVAYHLRDLLVAPVRIELKRRQSGLVGVIGDRLSLRRVRQSTPIATDNDAKTEEVTRSNPNK